MRAKDIAIGTDYAVCKSSYRDYAVSGCVTEALTEGRWRVHFAEKMISASWGYIPAREREASRWESVVEDVIVHSREVIAPWDRYLADVAEEKRVKEESDRRAEAEQVIAKKIASDFEELLDGLGCDPKTPGLEISSNNYYRQPPCISLTLPLDIAEALLKAAEEKPDSASVVSSLLD